MYRSLFNYADATNLKIKSHVMNKKANKESYENTMIFFRVMTAVKSILKVSVN